MASPRLLRFLSIALWLLIALPFVGFFLIDLSLDFGQTQVACSGLDCNYLAISQAEMAVLAAWGLSPLAYALVVNGFTVLNAGLSWALAVVLLWRQGATRIGWAVSLAMLATPVAVISDVNNLAANIPALALPAEILSFLGTGIWLLFFYLFPNGRFYPRWAAIPLAASFVSIEVLNDILSQPAATPGWLVAVSTLFLFGMLLTPVGFQILRYRNVSSPPERQQTKWILLAFALLVLAFPVWMLTFSSILSIPPGQPRLLATLGGWLLCMTLTAALPFSMAVAILRYRLWDIDLVIRRTLTYAILSAALALIYLGSVIVLQAVVVSFTGQRQSEFVTVISTLGIAALFVPVRARVQQAIDRRFFRSKVDAAQALSDFAASARDETDLARLTAQLVQVVDKAMQPASVGLWVRGSEPKSDKERQRQPQ